MTGLSHHFNTIARKRRAAQRQKDMDILILWLLLLLIERQRRLTIERIYALTPRLPG